MADHSASAADATETTPLLTANTGEQPQLASSARPRATDKTMPVVVATWIELAAGALCVSFGVACAVIPSLSPEGFDFPWVIKDMLPGVIFFSIVAIFFAIYNLVQLRRLSRTLPVLLNILVDFVVAFVTVVYVGQTWDSVRFQCSGGYGHKLPDDALRRCLAWGQIVVPIVWAFIVMSGLVGFTALFLLIARSILFFQRRSAWTSPDWNRWRVPAGQLTIEFTIKLLRQQSSLDDTASADRRGASALASAQV